MRSCRVYVIISSVLCFCVRPLPTAAASATTPLRKTSVRGVKLRMFSFRIQLFLFFEGSFQIRAKGSARNGLGGSQMAINGLGSFQIPLRPLLGGRTDRPTLPWSLLESPSQGS